MKLTPNRILKVVTDLKPYRIPSGFTLIIDTREQRPLFTTPPPNLQVIHKVLPVGDYSIKGFEHKFCIERKQISDFYSYIGKERHKTVKKMEQMSGMWAGLVIEATELDILCGYDMSKVPPEVARQALVSFEVRYGIHIYYSRNREDIERYILDRAIKFYKIQREV